MYSLDSSQGIAVIRVFVLVQQHLFRISEVQDE